MIDNTKRSRWMPCPNCIENAQIQEKEAYGKVLLNQFKGISSEVENIIKGSSLIVTTLFHIKEDRTIRMLIRFKCGECGFELTKTWYDKI